MSCKFYRLFVCLGLIWSISVFSADFIPDVSVITSLYDADEFVEGFLEDLERQTIFSEVEFIIINANSPGNEEEHLINFSKKYPNVNYIKLDSDPGLYGVWNLGIKLAKGKYITNANLDDRMAPFALEIMRDKLSASSEYDLVYSDAIVTYVANETFENNTSDTVYYAPDFAFDRKTLRHCLPGHHPMWRKSLHQKFGFFDEFFKIQGDYEMWLRLVSNGIEFKRIPIVTGVVLSNGKGLSHNPNIRETRIIEHNEIQDRYKAFFDSLD